jgi:hypothetical protein
MKTARLFLGVVLSSCVLFVVACTGNDSTENCQDSKGFTCEKSGTTVRECCNGSQCSYKVDDQVFECKLSDCKEAAEKATAYCAGH